MAAKKIKALIKLNLPAGEATPAPPVGPALGQHGVPIMEFVKQYNDKTRELKGNIIPAVITVFEDRTFTFITKLPPVSAMIKKALGLKSASKNPGKEIVATLTMAQVREIAENKIKDMQDNTVVAAMNSVMGTARSMGIKVS